MDVGVVLLGEGISVLQLPLPKKMDFALAHAWSQELAGPRGWLALGATCCHKHCMVSKEALASGY